MSNHKKVVCKKNLSGGLKIINGRWYLYFYYNGMLYFQMKMSVRVMIENARKHKTTTDQKQLDLLKHGIITRKKKNNATGKNVHVGNV